MRVLKGMELQVILNDVAGIMDLPFSEPPPFQQQGQQQASAGGEPWSDPMPSPGGSSGSDTDDLFAWPSELKMSLNSPAAVPRKRKQQEQPRLREKARKQDTGCRMGTWQVDDLAGDLDTSLAGLGVDVSTASYSMSDALLALPSLPSLTVFKQEAPSPDNNEHGLQQQSTPAGGVGEADSNTSNNNNNNNHNNNNNNNSSSASQLHQLLLQHGTFTGNAISTTTSTRPQMDGNGVVGSTTGHGETLQTPHTHSSSSVVSSPASSTGLPTDSATIDCRFQYVLAAATSIATKVNEETLTYLNQGQSYEIKLKKLGELSAYRGKILKSAIRICFHERRLQYMEREQMAAWQASRPGDRIVEVDVPLSYGLVDVVQDPLLLNTVEFLWDPTKEVGVYIKVNCISTEFTPKKHGGEKGVPFRIQVETFLQGEANVKRLHAAACQIKVFKLKGADRKHKQDREKILKRPPCEQDKFQPSYECTVLNDIPSDSVFATSMNATVSSSVSFTPADTHGPASRVGAAPTSGQTISPASIVPKEEHSPPVVANLAALPAPVTNTMLPDQPVISNIQDVPVYLQPLASEATAKQTAQWLQTHRFGSYLRTFASFSGADILRLSRDDLIQICGLPDGIRLFNALHSKSIAPRLTVYLCVEASSVFHALYLDALSCSELASKLAALMGMTASQVRHVYLQGPGGIHVLITDEVVRNLRDEAMFTIELLHDPSSEHYRLLLKPAPR